MAKKSIEDLITETKELFVDREINYLNRLLEGEEEDKEEQKFINGIKGRLKFVEKMYNQLTGKTGKERSKGESELMGKILEMKSSVGKIVRSSKVV